MEIRIQSEGSLRAQFHELLLQLFRRVPLEEFSSKRQRRAWYRNVKFYFPITDFSPSLFDLDLGPTGFKFPLRWDRLLKEYLPRNWGAIDLSDKNRLIPIRTLVYHMKDRGFHPRGHANGACLNTCYFWGDRKVGVLRFHFVSRASYILPVGALDMNLMFRMAESILSATKFKKGQITWSVEQVTTSIWPSLPYLLAYPELREDEETWIGRQWKWAEGRRNDEDVVNSPYRLFQRYGQKKFHTNFPSFFPPPIAYSQLPNYLSVRDFDPRDEMEEAILCWEPEDDN